MYIFTNYILYNIYIYIHINYIYIYIIDIIYIYTFALVKMVEDHCSIAEALLSETCTKHCKALGPPQIMAQNTEKRYGPEK